MRGEQLASFTPDNALNKLQSVSQLGAKMFESIIFPHKHRDSRELLREENVHCIAKYWRQAQEGFQLTLRCDNPNFEAGFRMAEFMKDTEYVESEALAEDLWDDQDEKPPFLVVDPDVVPTIQNTLIIFGALGAMHPCDRPYADEFSETYGFWGHELTVGSFKEKMEELIECTHNALYRGDTSKRNVIPAAQFFEVGSILSNDIIKRVSDQYRS